MQWTVRRHVSYQRRQFLDAVDAYAHYVSIDTGCPLFNAAWGRIVSLSAAAGAQVCLASFVPDSCRGPVRTLSDCTRCHRVQRVAELWGKVG